MAVSVYAFVFHVCACLSGFMWLHRMCDSANIHLNLCDSNGNSCAAAPTPAHMSSPLVLSIERAALTGRRFTPRVYVQPVAPESIVAMHCLASVASPGHAMRQTTCEDGLCDLAAVAAMYRLAVAVVAHELVPAACVWQPREGTDHTP